MSQNLRSSRPETAFNTLNSHISAGGDINLLNVSINRESSLLTRLKSRLNPVLSASYDSYEAKQRTECFPNTRVQVLNDIEAWIAGKGPHASVYVLDGVAGIGKSTIAQTIAARAANLGLLGASFFFSRDEDLRTIAKHFFPTIAYQLGCYNDTFANYISVSLDKNPDAPTKRLYQQLSLLVSEPLRELLSQRANAILIVLDALDECEEAGAEELLSLLGQTTHQMPGLKFLVTTRPEWHLRRILHEDKNHERFQLHEIADSIVQSDIRLYLQHRLSPEELRKLLPDCQRQWQPSVKDMEMLCGICGTLFIIAATATRFILDAKRLNPQRQLSRLLDGVSTSTFAGSKISVLDETYLRVLLAAQPETDLDDSDDDWFRDLNTVLGALITLANPLPCRPFASLVGINPDDIIRTLSHLHSLVAPSGKGVDMTFRIHHKSFPDFVTNKERIQRVLRGWKMTTRPDMDSILWIDQNSHHLRLVKGCFMIMNGQLKWNMANITEVDWYKDKKIFPHIVPRLIPQELAYAVLHWSSHLLYLPKVDSDAELRAHFDTWASCKILYWMEVMVILDRVDGIYGILQNAITCIQNCTSTQWREKVKELLSDASRLVQRGSELMKISPMHIYRSCLPFLPTKTALYDIYRAESALKVGMGQIAHWDSLLVTCIGHPYPVNTVIFSPDNSQMVSGSYDNTIRLWNAKTGACIQVLTGHSDRVNSVALSRNGSQLASGSDDKTIRLWDVKSRRNILTLPGHSGRVLSIAFSNDSSQLASASYDETVRLWDAKTGGHIATLIGHSGGVSSIAFSKDDSQLVSGSCDQTIRFWNAKTGVHILTMTGHFAQVNSVDFSNDGSQVASGSIDETVRIWDTTRGTTIHTLIGHSHIVWSVAFSREGSKVASASGDQTIRIWDASSGAYISTLSGHSDMVLSIAFSADDLRLASGSSDSTVRLWDCSTSRPGLSSESTTPRHSSWVSSIAFSEDGSRLAYGTFNSVSLWDARMGKQILTLIGHNYVLAVAFSSDGSQLAFGSLDTVTLWDAEMGAHIFTLIGHSSPVTSVAFSKDGSQLASGSVDNTIRIWDAITGVHLFTLAAHSSQVCSIAFSSDGSRLASGSRDSSVWLWDTTTGEPTLIINRRLRWVNSIAFSGDDSLLASASSNQRIRLWDTETGALRSTLSGWLFSLAELISVVFLTRGGSIGDPNRTSLLLLVKRETPLVTGLVRAIQRSGDDWEIIPLCWFPPDMEVYCSAVNLSTCQVAVGCKNGRVMVLDFSSELYPSS